MFVTITTCIGLICSVATTSVIATVSVPEHGQDWAIENCTQADYPLCFRFQADPNFADKEDFTAFDMTSGEFYEESWRNETTQENLITEPDGTENCWTYDGVETGSC